MDVGEPEVVPREVPNSNPLADAIRQGTKSTCQLVVLSLGNSVNLGIVDAVSVIVRVARRAHGEAVVMAKTRRGCKELLTGYAAGDFENELIGIAGLLRGTDNIRSMGLIDLRWPVADIDNIETILSHVFDLFCAFLGERLLHSVYYMWSLPFYAAILQHHEKAKVEDGLLQLRRWWAVLSNAEEQAKDSE